MAAAVRSPAAERLRAHWKRVVKHLPPVQRLAWLSGEDGIAALGAKQCQLLRKEIERRHAAVLSRTCSDEWREAWDFRGTGVPGHRVDLVGTRAVLRRSPDGRRFSVRLVLSGQGTASGIDVPGEPDTRASTAKTRRLTPPQCVESEDTLDAMTPDQARFYSHPPSPSAVAIFVHCTFQRRSIDRMRDRGGRAGRLKARLAQKTRSEQQAGVTPAN